MENTSTFFYNNKNLSLLALGIGAAVGLLNYYAIRRNSEKNTSEEKIDALLEKLPPIINPQDKETLSGERILMGQGEYIVFHKHLDGIHEVTWQTYEKVYQIFCDYNPAFIMNRNPENGMKECSERYEIIKNKVKKIDDNLEITFIPRTLYELILIIKCIKEDLKHKSVCNYLNPAFHEFTVEDFNGSKEELKNFQSKKSEYMENRKCWHLCYFEGNADVNAIEVKKIAFRLNQLLTRKLCPNSQGFTFHQLSQFLEQEIEFLKNYYVSDGSKDIKVSKLSSSQGPSINFGQEYKSIVIQPMGIRDDKDAKIYRNALALDCSKAAEKAFILYRGADYEKDHVIDSKGRYYSLSLGTGVGAGVVYDGGACVAKHGRNEKNAYAIFVPFDEKKSPFYIPIENTITQAYSIGETFHPRTKSPYNYDLQNLRGICMGHLKSDMTGSELILQFKRYKREAVHIK
ncbi:MAG: hypothetical protein Tsb0021_03990 [Chlamydiales bacterium]